MISRIEVRSTKKAIVLTLLYLFSSMVMSFLHNHFGLAEYQYVIKDLQLNSFLLYLFALALYIVSNNRLDSISLDNKKFSLLRNSLKFCVFVCSVSIIIIMACVYKQVLYVIMNFIPDFISYVILFGKKTVANIQGLYIAMITMSKVGITISLIVISTLVIIATLFIFVLYTWVLRKKQIFFLETKAIFYQNYNNSFDDTLGLGFLYKTIP